MNKVKTWAVTALAVAGLVAQASCAGQADIVRGICTIAVPVAVMTEPGQGGETVTATITGEFVGEVGP